MMKKMLSAEEKIKAIEEVFDMFHNQEDEDGDYLDGTDALMRIERIVKGREFV